jgi:hypothetical protein
MAVASALIGAAASIGGGLLASGGAKSAANAQAEANAQAIAEQRRQFDRVQQLLAPYAQGGTGAFQQLLTLAGAAPQQTNWQAYAQSNPALMQAFQQQQSRPGMFGMPAQDLATFAQQWQQRNDPRADLSQFQTGGMDAQQQAISQLEQSPMFQALARQGEEGILQNASATGGLRGGNVQGALGQFRPALLNQQIQQQLSTLGGIAGLGQNAAAGVGNADIQTGQSIGALMRDTGQARGYGALGSGMALGQGVASLGNILGGALGGQSSFNGSGINSNSALGSLSGIPIAQLPPMPGLITGYGSGTFDASGRQVTF